MSVRDVVFPTVALLVVLAPALSAQDFELPTPEEYAERAEVAENAPLFQSDEPLKITLLTDIKWLRDKRIDTMEIDGTLTFMGADGTQIEQVIEVRTRGIFRRNKRNCNFPPLRFDFPKKQMEGTVFEGQNKLKLVTPCHDSRSNFQRYVYAEYLAYKAYQLLTPAAFRVRLVEITYMDINDDYDTRTKVGFLIESDENMAERNRATHIEYDSFGFGQFHPRRVDDQGAVLVGMFNYMIGNTDWSAVEGHNTKLIRTETGKYLTVPYDFDFSGAVNARYAAPDESLSIRRVTDRLYRGFCRTQLVQPTVAAIFNEQRDALWDLYMSFELLEENRREDWVKYYENFYKTIDSERDFDRRITRVCRSLPA